MPASPPLIALVAALLFGASTPLAKLIGLDMEPMLLAGLLYLGSGLGLLVIMLVRAQQCQAAHGEVRLDVRPDLRPGVSDEAQGVKRLGLFTLPRRDVPWLFAAIVFGGILAPVLLMTGLRSTEASSAALLLNLEGVLTALLAWTIFGESAPRRIVVGMLAIIAGGVLLSWQGGTATMNRGALLIAAACLCWAIDNNFTRKVATNDALLIAAAKGLVAGVTNTALALATGSYLPALTPMMSAMLVGFAGYGLSLVLFVLALRALGSARTGAYFSVAPLFGVVVALVIWPAWPDTLFWWAAGLMALGVWLHVSERHEHDHQHEACQHDHAHIHDVHHAHRHDFEWDGHEPHVHAHRHLPLTHRHSHYPDDHHRHVHEGQ